MLTGTLKAFVNKPFQENFDTTFMENMKNCKEKKLFLYNKKFQKTFHKPMFYGIC